MDRELHDFVRAALERSLPRPAIREQLLAAGWRDEEVRAALAAFAHTNFPVPVPRRKPYLGAREAFAYLVLFFTLYTSAINLGILHFRLINRALPDALRAPYENQGLVSDIRGATAALIIAFPIFLLVARALSRAMARDPEKRTSKIRRWLTYITLFVAAATLIGDLIALVRGLLTGELTPRFLLKVLDVLVIAGTVFGYYLWSLRQEELEAPRAGAPEAVATDSRESSPAPFGPGTDSQSGRS